MTYSLINKCAKNYYNRTFIVQVIAKNVVTCFFLRHSVCGNQAYISLFNVATKHIFHCSRNFIVLLFILHSYWRQFLNLIFRCQVEPSAELLVKGFFYLITGKVRTHEHLCQVQVSTANNNFNGASLSRNIKSVMSLNSWINKLFLCPFQNVTYVTKTLSRPLQQILTT